MSRILAVICIVSVFSLPMSAAIEHGEEWDIAEASVAGAAVVFCIASGLLYKVSEIIRARTVLPGPAADTSDTNCVNCLSGAACATFGTGIVLGVVAFVGGWILYKSGQGF